MALFSKLKDRLFKSSSRLEEGLDAIVTEGGTADPAVPAPDKPERPAPDLPQETPPTPEPDLPEPAPEETPAPEPEPEPERTPEPGPDLPRPSVPPGRPTPDLPGPTPDEVPQPAPDMIPTPVREAPRPAPTEIPTGTPTELPPGITSAAPARGGLMSRFFGGRGEAGKADAGKAEAGKPESGKAASAQPTLRRALDDDMLERLEELLIASDMGVDTALRVTANMAEGRMGQRLSTGEIKTLLAREVTRIMEPVARPMPLYPKKPQVVLVVGVNGSGKTTTIGKLASQFRAAGKSVIIAAGDTFRAAAVEQLEVWGQRAGVPVLKAGAGTDPASLVFDAMTRAEAEGVDLLMIDTAGRLQNRADLMEELSKIVRVIRKKDPSAPHNTLLVLDATTGQNALSQVETFRKLADVSGLVMTKLDGTAKGGVLVALADKFGLPIHAIGVGEQIDDLSPFDPEDFARALTGA
ncbi:signal recognition particle-docking protein FtsY [Pseudooceanicola spongiae]|uniref:Signal recognition particle receptor FtsY n=1 Tax=Pseudooceanicola spongiae TaxID=2613965 RepID=A0A7L9WMA3_9RHOB|nr:signal recognition particle-docking protein FtsY [Pseudooceanicola spongiae]QOL81062.1 signal recognition particle-docking protein FtsY [Pseudooceanicola spongiae]